MKENCFKIAFTLIKNPSIKRDSTVMVNGMW